MKYKLINALHTETFINDFILNNLFMHRKLFPPIDHNLTKFICVSP